MAKTNINDGTDAMDRRLEVLRRANAPASEIDAAIVVYERVRTARAICQSYLSDPPDDASVVALAVALGHEAHAAQGVRSAA